jgi:hypothetical protein
VVSIPAGRRQRASAAVPAAASPIGALAAPPREARSPVVPPRPCRPVPGASTRTRRSRRMVGGCGVHDRNLAIVS